MFCQKSARRVNDAVGAGLVPARLGDAQERIGQGPALPLHSETDESRQDASGRMISRSQTPKVVIETDRLLLRELAPDDAPFVLQLVNEPSWLEHIGDKNVHSIEDAERYIIDGPRASYIENGFGLYLVTLVKSGQPIGLCGLLKRATLEHPDIGFAFLPEYWGRGYALEAARGVLDYATGQLRISVVAAITKPENKASLKLLEKLGMRLARTVKLNEAEPDLLLLLTPHELVEGTCVSDPSKCQGIEEIRAEIDEIDKRIIALIGQRYDYVKAIVGFKTTEAEVRASDRLRKVIETRRELAVAAGLDPELVETLYRTMIEHFIQAELDMLKERE